MVTLACKSWLLSFMNDNLEANVLQKPLEEYPKPSKQRNLVQVIDHSENLHSESISPNGLYVLHLSDGFHFVTAKLSPKSIKRLYKRFPHYKPLSKLRGAIIRLDDYSFVLGGPNRSLCSIMVNKFDYVGAALSGTFRSPSNISSTLSKHFSFQNQQLTRLNNHLINPNNLFLQNNQKKQHHSPLRPSALVTGSIVGRNSILNIVHSKPSINNNQDTQQKQTTIHTIPNLPFPPPHNNNTIHQQHSTPMNHVQSKFFAPFLNVFTSNKILTNEKIPQQPNTRVSITEELEKTTTSAGIEVFHHKKQEEIQVTTSDHQEIEKSSNKEIYLNYQTITTTMEDAQPSQNSLFVENLEDACEIPASQLEQLKNMEIPGFANDDSVIEIPIPSIQQLRPPEPSNSVSSVNLTEFASSASIVQNENITEEYTQRNESPSHIRRMTSTPHKRRTTTTGFLSPDLEIPSKTPQKLEMTPSIIQSQVITSDNDSDDAMEDIPEIIPFSNRSGSVFSPTRYKNMAPPVVYLHSQNLHTQITQKTPPSTPSQSSSNTSRISSKEQTPLEIQETPVKDIDEFQDFINRRNNRSGDESFDSSEDENEKYEAFMGRSLFKNPLHLEEHAMKKLEQRALPHHKKIIQARERRREEDYRTNRVAVEVETDIEITPDTMMEILKDPPIENRKRQIVEEKPKDHSKKQKTNPPQASSSSTTTTITTLENVVPQHTTTLPQIPQPTRSNPSQMYTSKPVTQAQEIRQPQQVQQPVQQSSNQSNQGRRAEKKSTENPRKKANYGNWSAFL